MRWAVVGAGAAGCVIAARLSEDAANDVTLLEAGAAGSPGAAPDERPRAGEPVLDDPARLEPLTVIRRPGSAPTVYAQGRGLGGSSLVNPGVVTGDPGAALHGHDLPIEPVTSVGPIGAAVLDATTDARRVSLVARAGRRVTAAEVYLPVRARPNLSIVTDARVDRLVFDGRRVAGVVTESGDEFVADRVVLAAGAVGSPTILLRSGVDTPGVGARLQDHAGVAISFEMPVPTADVPAIGVTVERPDRQIVVMDRLPGRPEMGAVIAGRLTIASEGRVSLPDPDGSPRVELAQLTDTRDFDGLAAVVQEAIALLTSDAAAGVIGDCYVDGDGMPLASIADERALRSWLPTHLGGYHHLAGSCRVGRVVDEFGALVGYDGVLVCDASVLPGVPASNPYLTVVRHAERTVARWRR